MPSRKFVWDPEHWRFRAEEARTVADQMTHEDARTTRRPHAQDGERWALQDWHVDADRAALVKPNLGKADQMKWSETHISTVVGREISFPSRANSLPCVEGCPGQGARDSLRNRGFGSRHPFPRLGWPLVWQRRCA
jgi:hypothetical protein